MGVRGLEGCKPFMLPGAILTAFDRLNAQNTQSDVTDGDGKVQRGTGTENNFPRPTTPRLIRHKLQFQAQAPRYKLALAFLVTVVHGAE